MSATVTTHLLDIDEAPAPFARLVKVEMRKMLDTRAGRWLLVAIFLLTALVLLLFSINASSTDRTFFNYMQVMATPQGLLLPVLGILLVTSEWSQRAGLTTFSLEPRRSYVLGAKVVSTLLLGLAVVVVCGLVAALLTSVAGGSNAWDGVGVDDVFKYLLLEGTNILQGLAFAMALLNSAAAIVSYYVVPSVFSIVVNLISGLDRARGWIDLNTAQQPLTDGSHLSGEDWGKVVTTILIWVALPAAIGIWRVAHSEVK